MSVMLHQSSRDTAMPERAIQERTSSGTAAANLAEITRRDPRWQVLLKRKHSTEHTAQKSFYYSVSTTGVYCLPQCAARLARPEHVRFHDTREEAEAAGFRPCKRCRPDQASSQRSQVALVAEACRLLESAEDNYTLTDLAAWVGLSPSHFHRLFKATMGLTPKAYAAAQQRKRVALALQRGSKVTDAIYAAGYGSNSRFYEKSDAMLGMNAKTYQAGGVSTEIRFAVAECSLGSVLVAQSERGICAILLGDDPAALVRDLQDRFPRASLVGGDHEYEKVVAQVIGYLEAPADNFDLPLDIRGTAFQQRVWQVLRQIPAGSTLSYTDVAARLGEPKAVRAVAQACGANALAVAIPCHRVVRLNGDLSGYRWGIARKRQLLHLEGNARKD